MFFVFIGMFQCKLYTAFSVAENTSFQIFRSIHDQEACQYKETDGRKMILEPIIETASLVCATERRCIVLPVRYELNLYVM
jgi:hypothetical protein